MLSNNFFEDTQESPWGVAFRDLLMGALGLLFIIISLLNVAPVNKKETDKTTNIIPGNVVVQIFWPPEMNTDIDLWVWNSKEEVPIGYSNRGGATIDLLRDDLGLYQDTSGLNTELTTSRGLIEGKWIVNLHYYSGRDQKGEMVFNNRAEEVPVKILITLYNVKNQSSKDIYQETIILKRFKQEVTALNFELDDKGKLVPGSRNSIYIPLREIYSSPVETYGRR